MKEKLITKVPSIFTEAYQRFQENYWLYGSTTVAGFYAGMLIIRNLQERQAIDEVQTEAEQIVLDYESHQEAA